MVYDLLYFHRSRLLFYFNEVTVCKTLLRYLSATDFFHAELFEEIFFEWIFLRDVRAFLIPSWINNEVKRFDKKNSKLRN